MQYKNRLHGGFCMFGLRKLPEETLIITSVNLRWNES